MFRMEDPMNMSGGRAISAGNERGHMRMFARHAVGSALLLLSACGTGGDSGSPEAHAPLATPMALVVNQGDTTMTTVRLDGTGSPVLNTLSLGPVQPDAIGGVAFSLGEWIFVTNKATNKVAAIDPIGALAPILEDFLDVNGPVRLGLRPTRIYRYPGDKEVLLTMNEGDPITGLDTIRGCAEGGSVTVLHNSHLSAGGEKPRVTTTVCLSGTGEHLAAFSLPTPANPNRQEFAFVSSKTAGLIDLLLADPRSGNVRWSPVTLIGLVPIDLCDSAKEQALGHQACDTTVTTPNHSAPAGMFWSQATGMIYCYLAGYNRVVEINPDTFGIIRTVDITPPLPSHTVFHSVGITPNGRSLFLAGEDRSDPDHVFGTFGSIDLTVMGALSATELPFPRLRDIRPARFQFTPNRSRIYMTQSNEIGDLNPTQAANLRTDLLLIFDPSFLSLVLEVTLPPAETHALDLWITGPPGAGSAKGAVVTSATPGVNGTVSLVDGVTNTITSTIPVGKNPKLVTVYYYGLAASDNQATPGW
jgi:hypothetical protein